MARLEERRRGALRNHLHGGQVAGDFRARRQKRREGCRQGHQLY